MSQDEGPSCALPHRPSRVELAHGGGGRAMRELLERVFYPAFANPALEARHDSAVLPRPNGRLALTTDTYVVRPLFFPGGDIGSLAIHGTLNDLAMVGAEPLHLAAGFVLEEGLDLLVLERVAASMGNAARKAGVAIVAGDTKVVERGHADGLYVTTTGVGAVPIGVEISPGQIEADDVILVSGDVGRHGVAVLSIREGLSFGTDLESDSADLSGAVRALIRARIVPHCLRDCTRGGLGAALVEIALDASLELEVVERAIPVSPPVRGASELLGLDPLFIACEGRMVLFVSPNDAAQVTHVLESLDMEPARIGRVRVRGASRGRVWVDGGLGSARLLELPWGEQLPRIC